MQNCDHILLQSRIVLYIKVFITEAKLFDNLEFFSEIKLSIIVKEWVSKKLIISV